jgi:HAD superfamily hydrolase (TIGR01458 family)
MTARTSVDGAALADVRALLLDFDGVLALAGKAIDGSPEALADLDRRGIPFRVISNTSLSSRATLAERVARRGVTIPAEHWITALSVSASWTGRHFPGEPLFVLGSDDAKTEFTGQRLLTDEEAVAPDALAAAVIVGDSPEKLTWANVNAAFGLIRRGARLVAMHRNKWWITPAGPTIDSGAYVAALEFATGARARVIGKPSREAFSEGVRALRAELPGLRRAEILMVGDDLESDVGGGRRAGLRTALVLTGKHGEAKLADAGRRGRSLPDVVAPSLAGLVAALR